MTETSYIWDGTSTGDATTAPYDGPEFNTYMLTPSTGEGDNYVYVVPEYLSCLRVYNSSIGYTISVAPGAAIIGSKFIYVSDDIVNLNITPVTATDYARLDMVVLRVDTINQTIRLAVVEGSAVDSTDTLEEPTLTQTDTTREIAIARVYIDYTMSHVLDEYIVDKRIFATNFKTSKSFKLQYKNIITNSEFMAFSSSDTVTDPEGWSNGGAANTLTPSAAAKLSKMSRGQSIAFGAVGEVQAIKQIINIDPNVPIFTVRCLLKDTTGGADVYNSVGLYPATANGSILSGTYKVQKYTRLAADTEIDVQFTVEFDINASFGAVVLIITNSGGGIELGQCMVVHGYHPGPYREFSENILFRERMTDAGWSDTAKSSGTTTVDLTTFGVLDRIKGAWIRTRGRDSGSAGGSAYIELVGYAAPYNGVYGRVELSGITNNVYRENTFYVPVGRPIPDAYDETPQLRAVVVATGAGTFDATLEVVGIQT